MDIKKIIGYVLAGIGLVGIAFATEKGKEILPFLKNIPTMYILIAGTIIVSIGVVLLILAGKGNGKQPKEVPIYEGSGKKRKVVAYQRMSNK